MQLHISNLCVYFFCQRVLLEDLSVTWGQQIKYVLNPIFLQKKKGKNIYIGELCITVILWIIHHSDLAAGEHLRETVYSSLQMKQICTHFHNSYGNWNNSDFLVPLTSPPPSLMFCMPPSLTCLPRVSTSH